MIRELTAMADMQAVAGLFGRVWLTGDAHQPVQPELLRALAHAGNYVAGAYVDGQLAGAAVGFRGGDGQLHSHITAVLPWYEGRGVGRALKAHQRSWAVRHGLTRITWTFDPLVTRNAHFNLVRLGARVVEYLVDFYGEMTDGVNGGQGSDRLLVSWGTTDPPAVEPAPGGTVVLDRDPHGGPLRVADPSGPRLLVAGPADIAGLRESAPGLAYAWRTALRDTLLPTLAEGYRITGVTRTGWYALSKETS
ncbi:GNAT family N-acetyltransferase [Longispora sp. K20-0274]|uniref:GNAT family N-acetyltransferase n=1 Tax=Longispora sp. K20-0274 TaxID=3088255 RepID=UPI00399AB501